ncbi:hypothetical protein [Acidisoma sp. 7E03]
MKTLLLRGTMALGLLTGPAEAGTHPLNGYGIQQQDYGSCTLTTPCPVPAQPQVDANTAAAAAAQATATAAVPLTAIPNAPLIGGAADTGFTSVTPDATLQLSNGKLGLPAANSAGAGTFGNVTVDAQGRIIAIHAPTPSDIGGFTASAAAAAPVQSVGGQTGAVSNSQLLGAVTTALGYTPPKIGIATGTARDAAAALSAEQANASAAAAAQATANAAVPLVAIPNAPLIGGTADTGFTSVTPDATLQLSNGKLGLPAANNAGAGTFGNVTVDAEGRITAIHAPTPSDIGGFTAAAAAAAPVQSVGGQTGAVSNTQLLGAVTTALGYTPPKIGTVAGTARDAAAAISAEQANASAAAAAQATANAAFPASSAGSMASQSASAVAITGGNLDGVVIGANSLANAYFGNVSIDSAPVGAFWGRQGAVIGWNYPTASGATAFVNSRGGGIGGFRFYNVDTSSSSVPNLLGTLDAFGDFSATSFTATGVSQIPSTSATQTVAATSGGTATITNTQRDLLLTASAAISSYKVVFPSTPVDGEVIHVCANESISTLSLSSSAFIVGNEASLNAGNAPCLGYEYFASPNYWVRLNWVQ